MALEEEKKEAVETDLREGSYQETENDLRQARSALLNILDDTEMARRSAVEERNKTLAIIQNFSDAILFFNEDNILELVNPLAEKYLDEKKEDIIGMRTDELLAVPKTKSLMEILEVSEGSPVKQVFRKEFMAKPNFYLEITSVMLIIDSKLKGTLLVLHDITREKNIEKMKSEFVSISAHQLRTPLSAIKWTLRMVLDKDIGAITPEQKDVLEKSYASNERMINLVNDLLNVTRIEEGRFLYKPEPVQIEELIQAAVDNLQEEAKRRKMSLAFAKTGRSLLPMVKLDKEKMKLALDNLITNALKYNNSENGKVEVSIKKNDKEEMQVEIKDNGLGIPTDQQSRIFTKFFRGENVIRMEVDGSGLGLYTTKNIIEAHGGKIWFKSEEGKGATFYLTLPLPPA
jgi:PAS domain S-box-containing protein